MADGDSRIPGRTLVRSFRRDLGVPLVPYIMGGDTTALLEEIVRTGTNNLLCDYRANLGRFVQRLRAEPIPRGFDRTASNSRIFC